MSMFTTPTFNDGSDAPHLGFADVSRVREILATEGIPATRIEHLGPVFTDASTDDAHLLSLVARARTEVPELFTPPEPLPVSDAAHLLAAARGWSDPSPERQAALARQCARDDAEKDALARLGALLARDRAEASKLAAPPDPSAADAVRRIAEARGWVTDKPDAEDDAPAHLGQKVGA